MMNRLLFLVLCTYSTVWAKENLIGRYAHFDIVSYVGEFAGPLKLKSRIISYGITEYFLKQGKLMARDRFCFSDYKANLPFKSKTSDEFTQAIIPPEVELEILETNGKIRIYRPETPTLLGVQLDRYTDNFPSEATDARFVDADGDGKPGVTVNLTFGKFLDEELYIARKEIFSYDAEVMENGVIAGVVRDRSQQYIIGASKPDLVTENNPVQNTNLSLSPIYLAPMQEKLDCDELKLRRDEFFPKKIKNHRRFYRRYPQK